MHYAIDLVNHIRTVRDCAERLGCEAAIDARNLALDVAKGELRVRFQPRFLYFDRERGVRNLTYYFRPDISGFVGWLPYFNKVWPEALDKLAFKTRCRERGLRTPDWWTGHAAGLSDFLIKHKGGSLGIGIRGPYRAPDPANPYHQLLEGEFYERFIEGRIAKIWYWNSHPVCAELLPFHQLAGDGERSLRQLIEKRIAASPAARPNAVALVESVLTYWGRSLDTVPASGEKVVVSFRYASIFDPGSTANRNALVDTHGTPLERQLIELGKCLWEFVPENIRRGILYTVDAVLDEQGEFWLLEMNPNPGVHPDCYPAMIASVLQRDVSRMPSLGSLTSDGPHLKGGLVWAPRVPASRDARAHGEGRRL